MSQYGSLEGVLAGKESIKGKRAREGLAEDGIDEQLLRNKQLVSLHTSLSIPSLQFSWDDLRTGVPLVRKAATVLE